MNFIEDCPPCTCTALTLEFYRRLSTMHLHCTIIRIFKLLWNSFIFVGINFSWIAENLHVCGFLILWFRQSLYTKPIENMLFVEHLNLGFTCIHETHENLVSKE